MKKSRKGQTAIEGFTTVGIILLLFTMLVIMNIQRESELTEKSQFMDKRDLCVSFQSAISSILSSGSNSSYTFEMISHEPVQVSGRFMDVGSENTYSCALPTVVQDANITRGIVEIRNENSVITIDNV